jgi:hypothetical protein
MKVNVFNLPPACPRLEKGTATGCYEIIIDDNKSRAFVTTLLDAPESRSTGLADDPFATLSDGQASTRRTGRLSLPEAFLQVPHGVVCLLSALRFHQLTTQSPYDVWMAIANKAYRPKVNYPPIHFVRFSEPTLTYGIEQHSIEGRSLPITSSAKTVADCFKYRHKIGQDVAIEALRDYLSSGRSVGILLEACGVCRVGRVIRPYLDALL